MWLTTAFFLGVSVVNSTIYMLQRGTVMGWARLVRVRVEEVARRVELLRNHASDAEHCDAAHNKLLAAEVALGREAEGVKAYVEIKLSRRVLLRLNHGLHAINATPARPRGGVNSSPLDRARTAASSRHTG